MTVIAVRTRSRLTFFPPSPILRPPMPIRRGSVTFARFRAEIPAKRSSDTRRWLARGLAKGAFEPLDIERGEDDRAAGFVSAEDPGVTDFTSGVLEGEWALFAFRVDTLRIPSSAVRAELDRWVALHEKERGRPPTKGEKATQKDLIRHAHRQRAVPSTKVHDVSLHLASGELLVWAASRKLVDEIAAAIEGALEIKPTPSSVSALAVRSEISDAALAPTAALTGISGKEALHVEA